MRYVMKQKWLSWGDDFYIQDEQGQNVFFGDGKALSFGDQLSLQDMAGNELAYIKQRLMSWGPTFELYRGGELYAVVKKQLFTFFHTVFAIDVPGPDDLEAEGDFLDHEYVFRRSGQIVAQVSKKWFSWADTYGIDVAEGEDDILVLACVIVIDMVDEDQRRSQMHMHNSPP